MRHGMLAAVFLCLLTGLAMADELVLTDGSRIVGEVKKIHDGKVTILTKFAGELTFDWKMVKGVTTSKDLVVETAAGERVIGTFSYEPQAGQQVTGKTVGKQKLPLENVQGVWAVGTDSPRVAALKKKAKAEKGKWTLSLSAGVNGQTGNKEWFQFNGSVDVKYTTPRERLLLYARGLWAYEDGNNTAHEVLGGADLEVDITNRWFAFGRFELETDEFEDLDLRATAAAGLGYFLIREDKQELKVRGGVGFQHESYSNGTRQSDAIAELGVYYKLELTPWLLYKHSTVYYPTFSELSDYRLSMNNAVEIPLDKDKVWKFKLGVRNEYSSKPAPGVDRLDTYYYANIAVDIE